MMRPTPDSEAWNSHWSAFDAATRHNPAHKYRRELIFSAITGHRATHLRVLDLGCGQGDFLREARRRLPHAELAGIDKSTAGLELAQTRVPDARLHCADFSEPSQLPQEWLGRASHVVCSEVLEHLDDPLNLLVSARQLLAPDGVVIVTVPGGPRTAFDRHIGHRRHYTPAQLAALMENAGLDTLHVAGAGFPFFNLYKTVVLLRGNQLARDIDQNRGVSKASMLAMSAFDRLFRWNTASTALGWQTFGVFRKRR